MRTTLRQRSNAEPNRRSTAVPPTDLFERGQTAAFIALLVPVLVLAVAVVVDVGRLYHAKRWGQSVVDSAAVNGALALDPAKFGADENQVALSESDMRAAACGSWFTALGVNGGALTYDQVPTLTGCSATLVGDRGVRVTANVAVPVMFPGLYQAFFGGPAPAGAVSIPLVSESEFVFGITEEMSH